MNTADWYVPSINTAQMELPDGLYITMFDSKNHVDEGLTSEQIKTEYERNAKAVEEYVLCLSPERLALHETIVAMSVNLKFTSEDDFIEKFHKIYEEAVLPKIKDKEKYFEGMKVLRRQAVEQSAKIYFSNPNMPNIRYNDGFNHYHERFVKNLERYQERLNALKRQFENERPSRKDREEAKELQNIIDFMNENKERIIVDLVANAENLKENKRIVQTIISGKEGVFASNYIEQFEKLTQHNSDTRQSFLIVGGAASGKGSVTSAVKKEQKDANDLLEINPDLYKKLLLPYDEIGENIEFHAALTHAESSIVFDSIAEKWQNMCRNNEAPNILMDVVRAGKWQLDVLSTADTKISVSTPLLPVNVALQRCYERGVKTGRYVPTKELLAGHKEQIVANKNAMKRGIDYRFYNTNIGFGQQAPLVAEFDGKKSHMTIYDMNVMWNYFSKSQLNPDARSAEDLSFATPKSTAKELIEHLDFMNISIKDKDGLVVAMAKRDGKPIFALKDFGRLKQNMGEQQALDLLVGLRENGIEIRAEKEVLDMLAQNVDIYSATQENIISGNIDINCEQYAELLEHLVEEGVRVGKTENAYVYDFANDSELKDKKLIIGTQNLDVISKEASVQSYNEYDPASETKRQKLLIIDPKVYNTAQKREKLIAKMRQELVETGKFSAEGVYMNERRKITDDYLFNNSNKSEIQVAKPNPDAVRISYKLEDHAVKIPVQWGEYAIEKDGSIVIREKDMSALKHALSDYQKDKNPEHLLDAEGKAKIDVYGTDPFFIEDNYSNVFSETEYRQMLHKLVNEGEIFKPKNSTKYDDVIAYKVGPKDKIVMPDGVLLKEGDFLCVPANRLNSLQKSLDNNILSANVYSIKKDTMQKSYNMPLQRGLANDGNVL